MYVDFNMAWRFPGSYQPSFHLFRTQAQTCHDVTVGYTPSNLGLEWSIPLVSVTGSRSYKDTNAKWLVQRKNSTESCISLIWDSLQLYEAAYFHCQVVGNNILTPDICRNNLQMVLYVGDCPSSNCFWLFLSLKRFKRVTCSSSSGVRHLDDRPKYLGSWGWATS